MYSNFSSKNDVISLKNSTFRELQVLIDLIFRHNFQFSTFILQGSSKWHLIFSYFFVVFEKWANLSHHELLFNHILKADSVLISIHLSCTTENFKSMLWCVWDLELTKYNTLQPFEETRKKLHKPSCFNFSSGFDVLLFEFSRA